jgi:lipopolysaccharide cholinephosphotransferase
MIDKIFNEIGLKYWATGGTALGCIRNKGLIPWDDDIDICIYKEDEELLLKNEYLLR